MKKKLFKLVLLGTDKNVYGMARSLHELYGVKSLAMGKRWLLPTKYSRIVDVIINDGFDKQTIFMKKMQEVGKKLSLEYEKIILISCGDNYTELIVNNKKELNKYFITPYIDKELHKKLEDKDKFYKICEKYELDYPKTYICTYQDKKKLAVPFSFPVAIKPADSIRYLDAQFEGRKKAYKANNQNELEEIIRRIYNSSYRGNIIVQDYIPGDDSASFVLNTYSDANGKVKWMSWGDVLLEHYHPAEIGNYAAIVSSNNQEIYDKFTKFLEEINYVGFSHLDFKYDKRDNKYKLFEINIRQGRGSYYVTGSGHNIVRHLVEEYVYGKDVKRTYCQEEWLWLDIPKEILLKYVNQSYLGQIKRLIKEKKYGFTLFYKKDFSFKRYLMLHKLYQLAHKIFLSYFNQRGL